MEIDEVMVKQSPGLCRCCLSEGCYKDLGSEYSWMGETEIYADMLLECFDIGISQHIDGPNGPNRLICEVCITRLRDACNFKKQVVESEKKFIDMLGRGEFKQQKALSIEYEPDSMKLEPTPEAPDDDEVEYLDDIDFDDDEDVPLKKLKSDASTSQETITVSALPTKKSRGRPKKTATAVKAEGKTKHKSEVTKIVKPKGVTANKTPNDTKRAMTSTKRNRLMKNNAEIIIANSTACPFKWQRQYFMCFFCHKIFKNTTELKDHTINHHKLSNVKSGISYLRRDEKTKIDITELKCRLCKEDLLSIDNLVGHLEVVHKKNILKAYGYGVIPYHLNDSTYKCAICSQEFQYFVKLNQHMNVHYGHYICDACGKGYLSQDRLRCHQLSHGSAFHCSVCTETFDSLTLRKKHESSIHNADKTLKCLYCNETFKTYNLRKLHHKMAHDVDIPEYKCQFCSKIFHISSKMQTHIRQVHIKEKNFACSLCDQIFFSRTHVQKHMIMHYGERIHECHVCKKSYARKQTLRDHMRIHDKDRRFLCRLCGQGFVQNNSLKLHIRLHHPDVDT